MEDLAARIHTRLLLGGKKSTQVSAQAVANLSEVYQIQLTLDNFANPYGVILEDDQSRTVSCFQVLSRPGQLVGSEVPTTDVLVLTSGAAILGWVSRDQIIVSDEGFYCPSRNLREMPGTLRFAQPCEHLPKFGGRYHYGGLGAWECFECGELLGEMP